jgi:hypothetical protein
MMKSFSADKLETQFDKMNESVNKRSRIKQSVTGSANKSSEKTNRLNIESPRNVEDVAIGSVGVIEVTSLNTTVNEPTDLQDDLEDAADLSKHADGNSQNCRAKEVIMNNTSKKKSSDEEVVVEVESMTGYSCISPTKTMPSSSVRSGKKKSKSKNKSKRKTTFASLCSKTEQLRDFDLQSTLVTAFATYRDIQTSKEAIEASSPTRGMTLNTLVGQPYESMTEPVIVSSESKVEATLENHILHFQFLLLRQEPLLKEYFPRFGSAQFRGTILQTPTSIGSEVSEAQLHHLWFCCASMLSSFNFNDPSVLDACVKNSLIDILEAILHPVHGIASTSSRLGHTLNKDSLIHALVTCVRSCMIQESVRTKLCDGPVILRVIDLALILALILDSLQDSTVLSLKAEAVDRSNPIDFDQILLAKQMLSILWNSLHFIFLCISDSEPDESDNLKLQSSKMQRVRQFHILWYMFVTKFTKISSDFLYSTTNFFNELPGRNSSGSDLSPCDTSKTYEWEYLSLDLSSRVICAEYELVCGGIELFTSILSFLT